MKIEHNRDFFLYKSTMLVHANTRVVRFQRDVLLFRCAAFTKWHDVCKRSICQEGPFHLHQIFLHAFCNPRFVRQQKTFGISLQIVLQEVSHGDNIFECGNFGLCRTWFYTKYRGISGGIKIWISNSSCVCQKTINIDCGSAYKTWFERRRRIQCHPWLRVLCKNKL